MDLLDDDMSLSDLISSTGLNSGTACVGILAHSYFLKLLTTAQFRSKLTMDPKTPEAELNKITSSQYYKRWCSAQLK